MYKNILKLLYLMAEYNFEHNIHSDLISEPQPSLFWNYNNIRSKQDSLNMLSLFSGCGGMDLGFEGSFICNKKSVSKKNSDWIEKEINEDWVLLKKNKFNTVFANDILKEAELTWVKYMQRFNIDPNVFRFGSIVDLVKCHQQGFNIFPANIDIVVGGFPCQDFSVAGKRLGFKSITQHDGSKLASSFPTEENRGKLYYWMKQVIDIVKPKVFVAENVKGLISLGDVKNIIQQDFASADGNDYIVLEPQILNAANYGVPEIRERVIFIGIRKSALKPLALKSLTSNNIPPEYNPYPAPTHNHTANDKTLPSPVTCLDIFKNLKEPEFSLDLSHRNYSRAKYMGKHCQGQTEIDLFGLAPTIRSEHHGNIEYRRLSKEHGGKLQEELSEGKIERRLSPRECALIQTFPPDFPFVFYLPYSKKYAVSPSGAYKVIGNAVPPMLAYNIARRLQQVWPLYFE